VFESDYLIVCDGGSLGNGATNQGYGSCFVSTRHGQKQLMRLDLGTATNNEAEYHTLIAALNDLSSRIQRAGKVPSEHSLLAHTGSQLLLSQLTQGWQVKAANLRPPVDEAAVLLDPRHEPFTIRHLDDRCGPIGSLAQQAVESALLPVRRVEDAIHLGVVDLAALPAMEGLA
jgi:ribonuclease HI